jgi:LPS sulfotransferase NodH
LCDLLAETGVAGQPGSYYRRQDIANWARLLGVSEHDPADEEFDRAYLGAVRQAGTGQTGVFGLRLMWETVAELSMRLSALYPGLPDDAARLESAFGRTLYLHLSRADKVAQAISLLRAEQSGLWHLAADGTERERTSPPQPAIYDPDRLSSLVKELEMDDAAWIAWFARHRIEPLWLSYETMAAAPQRTLADILSTLGQNPEIATTINTKTAKMADEISVEWTQRFRRESTLQRL